MQILSGRNEVLKPEFYPKPRFLSVTLFYMPSPHCNGTHSSTLAWKIPWTGEPGGPQSMGSLGVGHD